MKRIYLLLIAVTFLLSCKTENNNNNNQSKNKDQYVIMLSMDGFRWDYTDRVNTPNFDKIAEIGVKAESLMASFPTKTFPNHYTISTGLYPDNHGIVNNTFYMPDRDEMYQIRNRDMVEDGSIYEGEPIWVTAEKQGLKTASYFWVGSEADVEGIQPGIWKSYDGSVPYTDRIDSVISWLQLPENNRPHLITWYVDEPDHLGHRYGPNSEKIDSMVIELDKLLGIYMNKLSKLDIADNINVIVLSDHGMEEISTERAYSLKDLIPDNIDYEAYGGNPVYSIWTDSVFIDTIHSIINSNEHLKCYRLNEIPENLNYDSHERRGDLIVIADSSYSIFRRSLPKNKGIGGTHGYQPQNKNMDAIFYAYGPAFKKGYKMKRFQNIHIYPLIAHILELETPKIDGDLNEVKSMLK